MTTESRYKAVFVLFSIVVVCAVISASRWFMSHVIPFWAFCCEMWAMGMHNEVSTWLAPPLAVGLVALVVYGAINLVQRLWKTHRLVLSLKSAFMVASPTRLIQLLTQLELSPYVFVIATEVPLAFTFGLLKPRICVSTGMVEILTDKQLKAVLFHEDYHRRHYDPLKTLIAEWLGATLFFLPVVADLRDILLTSIELKADRHSLRHVRKASLAGALFEILARPQSAYLPSSIGISRLSSTEARISQLLDGTSVPLRFSARNLTISSAIIMLTCFIA